MSETEATPTVNVPLLRKTLEWAYGEWQKVRRDEISEWNQGNWMVSTAGLYDYSEKVYEAFRQGAACGTACCIAGKVALDDGWHPAMTRGLGGFAYRDGERADVFDIGRDLLGLTNEQANWLFAGGNTIYNLYSIANQITDGEIQPPPELIQPSGDLL